VRPGGFEGDYPAALRINRPPELETTAQATSGSSGWVDEGITRLRSSRRWEASPAGLFNMVSLAEFWNPLDVPVWRDLASALDQGNWDARFNSAPLGDTDSDYGGPTTVVATVTMAVQPGSTGPVLVYADVDDMMVASLGDAALQPIGPSGPTLAISSGFHRYRRTCTPNGQQSFAEVPLDAPVNLERIGWVDLKTPGEAMEEGMIAELVAPCGIDVGTVVDMGPVALPPPVEDIYFADEVQAMAWTPGSDGLYLVVDRFPAEVRYLAVGAQSTTLITSGNFEGPLTVATGGTSLLYWIHGETWSDYLRQSLNNAMGPQQATLPSGGVGHPTDPPCTVISPDGNLLASAQRWDLTDLRTLTALPLNAPALPSPYDGSPTIPARYDSIPLAWAPTGDSILVKLSPQPYWQPQVDAQYVALPLIFNGGVPTSTGPVAPLPAEAIPKLLRSGSTSTNGENRDASVRYFWSATGAQVLIQDADGARVYNFMTEQTLPMVEATRVAPPTASTDAVVATDQVFAWAMQCFGIGETHCGAELRRLSLATGAIDTVASADEPWLFAVSPDGKQIAFADRTNLYLKTIAP